MAPDGRTGVGPGSLGWRQTKERTGSEWPRMAFQTLDSGVGGIITDPRIQSELKLAQRLKLRAFLGLNAERTLRTALVGRELR